MRKRGSGGSRRVCGRLHRSLRWHGSCLANPLSNRRVSIGSLSSLLLPIVRRRCDVQWNHSRVRRSRQCRVGGGKSIATAAVCPRRFLCPTEFEHVPVKYIVVREALSMKQIAKEVPKIWIVGFLLKPKGAAEVEVCCEFSYKL